MVNKEYEFIQGKAQPNQKKIFDDFVILKKWSSLLSIKTKNNLL